METRLGELLRASDLITEDQLQQALQEQGRTGLKLGSTLVALGFVDENLLATFLSMQTGVPCVSLQNVFPSRAVLELVPKDVARRTHSIPLKKVDDALHVAMADPTDARVIESLARAAGLRIVPLIAPASAIDRAFHTYYPGRGRPPKGPSLEPEARRSDLRGDIEAMERAVAALSRSLRRLRERLGS